MSKASAAKRLRDFDAFSLLGRVVVRFPWLVIAAWIVLLMVLSTAFAPLTKIVEGQTMQALPPQAMAAEHP